MNDKPLLDIKNLIIHYETEEAVVEAVNNVSFSIRKGETLGLVGETGAGKTTIALGILKLISQTTGRIIGGEINFAGEDLAKASESRMRKLRGNAISMIFQDPMTALNPAITVGEQVAEVVRQHQKCSRLEADKRATEMLERVGIGGERFGNYPHEFSGGMKQRVVIATALACNPQLLIADEPTTALDVTIQAQVLDMIRHHQRSSNTAMLLITHDLGVVAEVCDSVAVIYAGQIVESGSLTQIFDHPMHPYTRGLFDSIPSLSANQKRLKPIPGLMPDPSNLPSYCSFCDRCGECSDVCRTGDPQAVEVEPGHMVRCFNVRREEG
ncbi:MAG: ABC transporter ATP-binding protein [Clostridia bacterium]|nr:ABC transporter ATP-binding protein [Clostridia bacterium]